MSLILSNANNDLKFIIKKTESFLLKEKLDQKLILEDSSKNLTMRESRNDLGKEDEKRWSHMDILSIYPLLASVC